MLIATENIIIIIFYYSIVRAIISTAMSYFYKYCINVFCFFKKTDGWVKMIYFCGNWHYPTDAVDQALLNPDYLF